MAKPISRFRPDGRSDDADELCHTNDQHADQAKRAMSEYGVENDAETAVEDLLANLMHFCHREDLDFEDLLTMASIHFEAEK